MDVSSPGIKPLIHCHVYAFNKFFGMGEINLVSNVIHERLKSISQVKVSGELCKGV
jgi:hypothetical protein